MYICVCHAVCVSDVRAAINAGAQTREEVTACCGAGGECGACHGCIEEMIEDATEPSRAPSPALIPVSALTRERAA